MADLPITIPLGLDFPQHVEVRVHPQGYYDDAGNMIGWVSEAEAFASLKWRSRRFHICGTVYEAVVQRVWIVDGWVAVQLYIDRLPTVGAAPVDEPEVERHGPLRRVIRLCRQRTIAPDGAELGEFTEQSIEHMPGSMTTVRAGTSLYTAQVVSAHLADGWVWATVDIEALTADHPLSEALTWDPQ